MANKIYGFVGLTGGGTGALDRAEIDGDDLNDKDMAIGVVTDTFYAYILDADSAAAESSPNVISPDTNAGDKRWILVSKVPRRVVTTTDNATAVIDVDTTDVYELSAVANATEFSTTGTPTNGQVLIIRFKDAGVAKAITWNAVFAVLGTTLPAITVAGKWHYVGCQYNSAATKWHVLAVGQEA